MCLCHIYTHMYVYVHLYVSNHICIHIHVTGSVVKNPPASAEDPGLIPGLGRSPGEGNGNSLQYSCLENPKDRGAWRAIVHGVAMSQTRLDD